MMINKHLLPQAVIDCVEKMLTERNVNTRDTFHQRCLTIKQFVDQALQEYEKKKR